MYETNERNFPSASQWEDPSASKPLIGCWGTHNRVGFVSLLGCFSQLMGQTLLGRRSKKALLLSCTYHDATRVGHRAAVKCLLQGSHSEFVQVQVIQGRLCQTEAPIICYKKDQQLQVIGKPKQPTCRDATALDCRIYRALFPPCIAAIVKLAFHITFCHLLWLINDFQCQVLPEHQNWTSE